MQESTFDNWAREAMNLFQIKIEVLELIKNFEIEKLFSFFLLVSTSNDKTRTLLAQKNHGIYAR